MKAQVVFVKVVKYYNVTLELYTNHKQKLKIMNANIFLIAHDEVCRIWVCIMTLEVKLRYTMHPRAYPMKEVDKKCLGTWYKFSLL